MSLIRHYYTSKKTGEARVYEYEPRPYRDAATSCRWVLLREKELRRVGVNRWRSTKRGRKFQNSTVEQLIRAGEAVRVGDVIRRAA